MFCTLYLDNFTVSCVKVPVHGACYDLQNTGGLFMKKLMLGNEAVARGLYEAGCKLVSAYPGTPSTEITEEAVKYPEIYCEWAPNEKVATEAALLNMFLRTRVYT